MTNTETTTGTTTMKLSDLIARLQAIQATQGDLPVYVHDPMTGYSPLQGREGVVRADDLGVAVLDLEAGLGEDE